MELDPRNFFTLQQLAHQLRALRRYPDHRHDRSRIVYQTR